MWAQGECATFLLALCHARSKLTTATRDPFWTGMHPANNQQIPTRRVRKVSRGTGLPRSKHRIESSDSRTPEALKDFSEVSDLLRNLKKCFSKGKGQQLRNVWLRARLRLQHHRRRCSARSSSAMSWGAERASVHGHSKLQIARASFESGEV